jgi:hypothetical protein
MSRREPGKAGRHFVRELVLCQETAPAVDDVCRKVGNEGHVTFREEVGFKEDGEVRAGKGLHLTADALEVRQEGVLMDPLGGVKVDESVPAST